MCSTLEPATHTSTDSSKLTHLSSILPTSLPSCHLCYPGLWVWSVSLLTPSPMPCLFPPPLLVTTPTPSCSRQAAAAAGPAAEAGWGEWGWGGAGGRLMVWGTQAAARDAVPEGRPGPRHAQAAASCPASSPPPSTLRWQPRQLPYPLPAPAAPPPRPALHAPPRCCCCRPKRFSTASSRAPTASSRSAGMNRTTGPTPPPPCMCSTPATALRWLRRPWHHQPSSPSKLVSGLRAHGTGWTGGFVCNPPPPAHHADA